MVTISDKMQEVKLENIGEIFSGLSYRRYLDNEGLKYPVIVQRSIKKDGKCDDFEEIFLKKEIKKRFFSKKNDVLMKMNYPYNAVCIKEDNLVISDRIAIIRVKKEYSPDFIAHLLNNFHINKQLNDLSDNEKTSHTSLKEIKQLKLIVPDLNTQMKYAELLNTINDKITEDLKLLEYDRNLKQAILNDLWVSK